MLFSGDGYYSGKPLRKYLLYCHSLTKLLLPLNLENIKNILLLILLIFDQMFFCQTQKVKNKQKKIFKGF